MKTKKLVLLLLLLLSLSSFSTTLVRGAVSGVWEESGNPYYITDSTWVPSSSSLRIMPGCEIIFTSWCPFVVDSGAHFSAIGTETDSIIFTARDTVLTPTSGGHQGLSFYKAPACSVVYCRISYGKGGVSPDGSFEVHDCGLTVLRSNDLYFSNNLVSDCKIVLSEHDRIGYGVGLSIVLSNNPQVLHSTFRKCYSNISGGGVHIRDCENILFENNILRDNTASFSGGGAYLSDCTGRINNNLFMRNRVGEIGSALHCESCFVSITNNIFKENQALYELVDTTVAVPIKPFAALYIGCTCEEVNGNLFIENCNDFGSVVHFTNWCLTTHVPKFMNNVVIYNEAPSSPAVSFGGYFSGATMINNTIAYNIAFSESTIVTLSSPISLCSFNNIHWNNGESNMEYRNLPVTHRDIWGIYSCILDPSKVAIDTTFDLIYGSDNINLNPDFVPSDSFNFRLLEESPCIDRGRDVIIQDAVHLSTVPDTTFVCTAPDHDYDGNTRPYGSSIDIGAYEYDPENVEEQPFELKPTLFKITTYPNPFNSSCMLDFAMGPRNLSDECVIMKILDSQGKLVTKIHTLPFKWEPDESIPSGIYYVQIEIGKAKENRKLNYVK